MTELLELYRIDNYIDTFALGHYARVLAGVNVKTDQPLAFKVMRREHLSDNGEIKWEYRAFINEAELLDILADSPHVINLLDCGYVSAASEAPEDGEIVSFGKDVKTFALEMPDFAEKRWRPYLALPNLPRTQNLFYLMKPNQQNSRWRLPTEEGLALALQFARLLKMAHEQNIVYLDHKLEHVYWDGNHLEVIDLNSSRFVNAVESAQYKRMDVHSLCVGILYPIFTGLSPQKTALRPQPSNRADVEARYQEIQALDFGVEPTLSMALQELLQRGAAMELESVDEFMRGLEEVASIHGWDFPITFTQPGSREARDHLRAGLRQLRQGQESIREARDLFRDAAILDNIPEDLEAELRRLVMAANTMLNHRVIP